MSNVTPDNDDDLDVENFDEGGFDDFSKKGTLGDLWRNNPMVKIGVILAAFAVVVGAIILFGGSSATVAPSKINSGSDVTEAPGTSEVSETMRQSIEDRNEQTVEEAVREGGSALPLPTDAPKGSLPIQEEEESGEDPLERWKRMQEERVRQQEAISQERPDVTAPPVDTKTPAVNALSQTMVAQMQAVLQNQTIPPTSTKQITDIKYLEGLENQRLLRMQQQQQMQYNQNLNTTAEQVENIIIPAGTIEYGQLLLEANTDAPGPVMAQIVSGPLRGSRVLGSFQSTDDYLVLSFSQVVVDGISYPVQAVAIDPGTTLPGVITEIDERYFKRFILPVAAEFVSGFADAVSQDNTTIIFGENTVSQSTSDLSLQQEVGEGISDAGDKLAEFLEEEADRTRPMLRVASGTPVGILFVMPVTDTNLVNDQ